MPIEDHLGGSAWWTARGAPGGGPSRSATGISAPITDMSPGSATRSRGCSGFSKTRSSRVWRRSSRSGATAGSRSSSLRFDSAQDRLHDRDGRDVSDRIEWATFGQRVLRGGRVTPIEEIAAQFYDVRHVLAFDPHRDAGEQIRRRFTTATRQRSRPTCSAPGASAACRGRDTCTTPSGCRRTR